ncbi:hypothetical protein IP90_02600 [Luteimonas cucumeris]|uniref:Uncharacterized protein n=1 Tax=Luteimonas cucumeris TaxID=985012 RepID=A0A562L036_9GAMM|nr:hypothetical protein [Luteimonas cucumeris]TWI00978.1 hypothetical protein IP90_02600 [Luteimonas cucumeris]
MNDQFQHVMVLISIIIGLAITHLLSGVVDAVDRANDEDEPEIFSALGALWAVTVFLWMVNFWWFQFRLLSLVDSWTLWRYLFIILYSVALYILAVILVPRDWNAIRRYPEYFMRNRRWFFVALLLAGIADVADAWLKGGWAYVAGMGAFNNIVALATIPVVAIGIVSKKVRTQTILAAIYFVLFLIAVFEYAPVLVVA